MPLLKSFYCNVDGKVYVKVKVRPWILNEIVTFRRSLLAHYQPSGGVCFEGYIRFASSYCISNNITAFNLVQSKDLGLNSLQSESEICRDCIELRKEQTLQFRFVNT